MSDEGKSRENYCPPSGIDENGDSDFAYICGTSTIDHKWAKHIMNTSIVYTTQSGNIKQAALQALMSLPENATTEDMMYRLYVLEQVHQGLQAAQEHQTTSLDDLKREIEQW
jgi:hypothetical protein